MSKQLDELMHQYFTGYRITEQEYNEAKTKENFAQEYYRVHDPKNGVCYYHRDPHDPAELTPILLNALLESEQKQEEHQKNIRALLEVQRTTEKHIRHIKYIIIALIISSVVAGLIVGIVNSNTPTYPYYY